MAEGMKAKTGQGSLNGARSLLATVTYAEMMTIHSIYTVICTHQIAASRDFYVRLLGLEVAWGSDWYVLMAVPGLASAQLALVDADHESLPKSFRRPPAGVVVSFEVDDATALHERAVQAGLPIAQELRDEEFGQRHFMTTDPDGLLVDIVETLFVPDQEGT